MHPALAIPILPARDLTEAIAYYEALDFACPFRQDVPDGYAILRHADGRELHLFRYAGVDPATNYAGCYWRVADVDVLHDAAVDAGVPVRSAPADRPWGMREFHLIDPSGNLIRIGREIAAATRAVPAG